MIFRLCSTLLILPLLFSFGSASLWSAIQASTANISTFRQLVINSSMVDFIDYTGSIRTVFIPTNAAFEKQYPSGVLTLGTPEKVKIVKAHLAEAKNKNDQVVLVKTTMFTDSTILKFGTTNIGIGKFVKVIAKTTQPVDMYMIRSYNTSSASYDYFINNAELVSPYIDQVGGSGMFHVINEVIFPVGTNDVMETFIGKNSTFSDFLKLITKFKAMPGINIKPVYSELISSYTSPSPSGISTFFVPTNAALQLPTAVKNNLENNETALGQFLMSHVAAKQVIFSSWMKYRENVDIETLLKKKGLATTTFNSTIYLNTAFQKIFVSVGGVTAQVLGPTQPLGNGVMIVINQPLNLLYRSVKTILQSKAAAFLTACNTNTICKNYIDGLNKTEVTVFAPAVFPTAISSSSEFAAILLLHILPGRRLTLATMPASTVELYAANSTGKLRFNQTATSDSTHSLRTTVYGRLTQMVNNVYSQGFVGSLVTEGDVAGTNGVVHIINSPLGYATNSIQKILNNRYSEFSKLIDYLKTFDINLDVLNNVKQRYTFFAPTNAALTAMEAGTGNKILQNTNDRNALFKRLLILNTVILSNLKVNTKYDMTTALPFFDNPYARVKVRLEMAMGRMKSLDGKNISFLQGTLNIGATNSYSIINPYDSEWGATNGVVYALTSIPYGSTTVGKVCQSGLICSSADSSRWSWTLSALILIIGQMILRTL